MTSFDNVAKKVREDALRQQEMLATFAEFALQSEDIDQIMHEACRCVCEAVQADMVLMYRLTDDARTVVLRAASGIDGAYIGKRIDRQDDGSVESALLRGGDPVVIPDVNVAANLETKHLLQRFGQEGLALLPLLDGPGTPTLGHFHVSTRSPRNFEPEIPFLRIYAGLVATSIMRIEAGKVSQREAEAGRITERYLRLIIDNIPQFVWCADATSKWRWSSPQWHQITGQDDSSSSGDGWRQRIHPDDVLAIDEAWRSAAQAGLFQVNCRIWHDDVSGYRWYYGRALPNWDDDATLSWMGTFTDIHDQRRLEVSQEILVAELQHRTRNLLTIVEGIALQTASATHSWEDFEPAFHGRLQALARVQTLLTEADIKPVTMHNLVSIEIDSVGDIAGGTKVRAAGPDVDLSRPLVQMLALMLHELLTNSIKYGALYSKTGEISICWEIQGAPPFLTLDWRETGLTLRKPASVPRKGFGRELIERAIPHQLGGSSYYNLEDGKLDCCVIIPLQHEDALS